MATPAPPTSSISVVMATYNSERFLMQALESVAAQTRLPDELIICDDASSDSTVQLASSFAEQHAWVRVVPATDNVGAVSNFQRCVREASGDYIKFLMPDDLLEPTALKKLARCLDQTPDAVLATSQRLTIDGRGEPLPPGPESEPLADSDSILPGNQLGDRVLTRALNLIGEPSTVMFRAGIVPLAETFTYHGSHFRVLADVSMWLSLLERGSACWLAEPQTRFRRHEGQDQLQRTNLVRANLEWLRLALLARRRGYLREPGQTRSALRSSLPRSPLRALAVLADPSRLTRQGKRGTSSGD